MSMLVLMAGRSQTPWQWYNVALAHKQSLFYHPRAAVVWNIYRGVLMSYFIITELKVYYITCKS